MLRRTSLHSQTLALIALLLVGSVASQDHLGGENATPEFALGFLNELRERLTSTGYTVRCTPFGWFCEWELDVHGESLAKVYKQI